MRTRKSLFFLTATLSSKRRSPERVKCWSFDEKWMGAEEAKLQEFVTTTLRTMTKQTAMITDLEPYKIALWPTVEVETKLAYQRQEYLGDAIVGLAVARYSYEKYPDVDEGKLTQMRSRLVSRPSLAYFSTCLDLATFREEAMSQQTQRQLADLFESFVGARFIDVASSQDDGVAYSTAADFVIGVIENFQQQTVTNYKGALNEVCFKLVRGPPTYTRLDNSSVQDAFYHFQVSVPVGNVTARGTGSSKQKAQQVAAKRALNHLQAQVRMASDDDSFLQELRASFPSGLLLADDDNDDTHLAFDDDDDDDPR